MVGNSVSSMHKPPSVTTYNRHQCNFESIRHVSNFLWLLKANREWEANYWTDN